MIELIQQYAATEFDTGDDKAVIAKLNAKSVKHVNTELVSIQTIEARYGEAIATKVVDGLRAAALEHSLTDAFYIRLASFGIDVSTTQSQIAIQRVTDMRHWLVSIGNGFKKLGIWYTSPASESIGRDITLDDVATARVEQAAQGLRDSVANAYNDVVAAIEAGAVDDAATASAAFATAMEG